MPDDIAIKVEHISKTFHEQMGARSVKQGFVSLGRKLTGKKEKRIGKGDFTALKDIKFDVKKGEFFGIVGRNGSGKSTLLKIMAGVYSPTKGAVTVSGNLTPFIELGVGFNPELSGRDNVFLNAALLGFTRKQTEAMYGDIVDFAELKDFMDVKLKNYSSGMQVRLAFSVAIRAESDILLIDEVLAVGDAAFQQKCFNYFEMIKKEKRTVVFVTHDMSSVRQYCDRAIYIEKSKVLDINTPEKISNIYEERNYSDSSSLKQDNTSFNIYLKNSLDQETRQFKTNSTINICIDWNPDSMNVGIVGIVIMKGSETIFATNTLEQYKRPFEGKVNLKLRQNLGDGRYSVLIGFFGSTRHDVISVNQNAANFSIYGNIVKGDHEDEWQGIMYIENEWT